VTEAAPRNGSGNGFITTTSYAECGRPRAIELVERVRPILDRLYEEWRAENPSSQSFEFQSERDASMRLIARLDHLAEIEEMLGPTEDSPTLAADGLHPMVWSSAQPQWSTGHRHEAVLAATKAVNSMLQAKLGRRDVSESKLVQEAFSERPPADGRPRLRYPAIEDEQTRDSMRQGVLDFGLGCFRAIRNPVGHLPNDEVELNEQEALERLAAVSLFARWIDEATVDSAGTQPRSSVEEASDQQRSRS
jgi:uncharacterized protein (TIGR02391 family)